MSGDLLFRQIHLPVPMDLAVAVRLLGRLAQPDTPRPLVFELRTDDAGIHYLVGSEPERLSQTKRLVEQLLVDARIGADASRVDVPASGRLAVRPGGLVLNTGELESTIYALYAALASRRGGETVVLQLTLGRGRRPMALPPQVGDPNRSNLWNALTRGQEPASSDVRGRMKPRTEALSIDAVIRLGVNSETPERRRALALDVLGALRGLQSPGVRIDLIREKPDRLTAALLRPAWTVSLTTEELAAFTGWPLGETPLPGLPAAHPKRLAAPIELSRTDNVFAETTSPGDLRRVGIRPDSRLQHLVVSGPTGSGKSMVFAHLALADIAAGRPCVVVDPKRQLIDFLMDRIPEDQIPNVVVLDAADPRPVGFNPLDTEGRNADVVVDGILSALKAVFADGWGPRTEDLLHAGLLTLARAGESRVLPYTLLDLPRLLNDAAFRRTVVGAVATDPTLASFWVGYEALSPGGRANIIAAPMNKLRKFVLRQNLSAVLGQPKPRFRLRDVFREGKTVLVPLNDALIGPGAAQLLGSLVASELWLATLERASERDPTQRPASIYIDEVQQFLNLPTSIADALATSRSYGVSWNLAHQLRAQLPAGMRAAFDANARSKVAFAQGPDDARDLARMAPILTHEDFMALPPYEIYAQIVNNGAPTNWFSARTLPPSPSLGSHEKVAQSSRTLYGKQVESLIEAPPAEVVGEQHHERQVPTHRKARRP